MSDRDRETWERFAAAALSGMWANATQSAPGVSEHAACASADDMLAATKERWPDELSGNPPELPENPCSPRCDAVTPLAAGDETVTEPDPGEGYRWVRPGENLRTGDQAIPKGSDGLWGLTTARGSLCAFSYIYRRRIDAAPETTPRADEVHSKPVMYSIVWDGDDTPDTEWCCSTEDEYNHYLGRFENRGGTIVPLYVVPVDAAREIAAARREAEEAKKECERLRLTDDERRLLSKYYRSEERAIVQFAVTSASYVADAKHATAVIGGLLARHDKGGAA
jgi:hypothetical protein